MLVRRVSAPETVERLKDRRRRSRRLGGIFLLLTLVVLLGALVWLTWQPYARIAHVSLSPENPRLQALVEEKLVGSYLGVIPRDSAFFVSERAIRSALLASDTGIRAVSVERDDPTSLRITLHTRVPVARWCGLAKTEGVEEYCYLFDADGLIYAASLTATTTSPLNSFVIYDALAGGATEPLLAKLSHASAMPNLFDFARKVGTLGSLTASATLSSDEASLALVSGTRIIYVLGSEEAAFTSLVSADEKLDLVSGALDYVDLRFPAKVYLKRRGDTVLE